MVIESIDPLSRFGVVTLGLEGRLESSIMIVVQIEIVAATQR